MGRPTTRRSPPARIAAAGGATRFGSPLSAPGGRMPGTTRKKPGPHSARTTTTSCGDGRAPWRPAPGARTASRGASERGEPAKPASASAAASRDVRTVPATTRGAVRPAFAAPSPALSSAARIISAPPAAWTFSIATPVLAAAAAAPATVFGMSFSFRSRKTFGPRATTSRTTSGPCETNASSPTFSQPTCGASSFAQARSSSLDAKSSATQRRSLAGSGIRMVRPRPRTERPHELGDARDASLLAPSGELGHEASGDAWVAEVRSADLHGARARDEELDHVLDRLDAAHPDDRHVREGALHLPHHPQRDRTDRGPGEAARREADLRLAPREVDREADDRVDEGENLGAALDGRRRARDDVARVGRELHDEREPRRGTHGLN